MYSVSVGETIFTKFHVHKNQPHLQNPISRFKLNVVKRWVVIYNSSGCLSLFVLPVAR